MNEKCPKCGYERQLKDDEFYPLTECPKCGVLYEKYERYLLKTHETKKKETKGQVAKVCIEGPAVHVPKMDIFQRIGIGWHFAMDSLSMLKKGKKLIFFPVLSTISLIFILAIFTGGIYAKWGFITETLHSEKTDETMLYLIFLFFIYYLINYAAIIFFNLALVHCTLEYINGAKPSLRKGIAFSLSRIVAVLSWALISATVAIILKIIEEKSERISDFITDLLGAIWSMLAFFVLPVMAYENLNVFQAIKRSGLLFKKTWGERVGASFAFGFIYIIFFLLIASIPCSNLAKVPAKHEQVTLWVASA